jgi:hypothetical protein
MCQTRNPASAGREIGSALAQCLPIQEAVILTLFRLFDGMIDVGG